ncbi:MAG: hydrogen peroxide-inducible genes activator [Gammaproteobacteria bacterium]|nr:hydrogen peroxide-inducible genes activator [Gammaproteobacteria bacterium]MCI0591599.1 hydrogen peroxide-inducible genes activator [Gammaproteobacteria bacterium]
MTLTELRYIVAVARERHFGRAAEACFVSQPTLSVAVRKLEDELGVILFERRQNEVSITPIGERIIQQAQQVLEEAETIRQIALAGKDQLRGPMRLGVIYTIGPYLLPHLIPLLNKRAPDLTLVIEESFTSNLRESLRRGALDTIIISLPFEAPGIITQPLYDEPFVLALPSKHPWSRTKAIRVEQLANETLLLLSAGNCFRDQVMEVCPACAYAGALESPIQKTLEGSSIETIRQMVASGAGITVLPCTAQSSRNDLKGLLTVRPFAGPAPYRRVALAYRRTFPRPRAIELLRQAVHDCHLDCVQKLEMEHTKSH